MTAAPACGAARLSLRARAIGFIAIAATGCAGGAPLLHPARTLNTGDVRVAGGVSANVATGALAGDLRRARELAVSDPRGASTPGSVDYAKGALVAANVAPGLAPFVGARVGVGNRFEGGLAYTGRGARADIRRSFDAEKWSLSLGLGASAALYGRQQGTDLPNVDLQALHGYGLDVPVLVGWESDSAMYRIWLGARAGFERDVIERVTSEPKSVTIGAPPINLDATRWYGGGLVGVAVGFQHVHVALELGAAYNVANGTYNDTKVSVSGLTLTPASALWWTFD